MTQRDDDLRTHAPAGSGAPRGSSPVRAPDMRVVTKGWWVLREERRSLEDLQREDRAKAGLR